MQYDITKDYYHSLGISKNADSDTIKSAFKKLAHRYHPDKFGDEKDIEIIEMMTKKFQEINEAYIVLNNSHTKSSYDYDRNNSNKRKEENPKKDSTQNQTNPKPVKKSRNINYFSLILKTIGVLILLLSTLVLSIENPLIIVFLIIFIFVISIFYKENKYFAVLRFYFISIIYDRKIIFIGLGKGILYMIEYIAKFNISKRIILFVIILISSGIFKYFQNKDFGNFNDYLNKDNYSYDNNLYYFNIKECDDYVELMRCVADKSGAGQEGLDAVEEAIAAWKVLPEDELTQTCNMAIETASASADSYTQLGCEVPINYYDQNIDDVGDNEAKNAISIDNKEVGIGYYCSIYDLFCIDLSGFEKTFEDNFSDNGTLEISFLGSFDLKGNIVYFNQAEDVKSNLDAVIESFNMNLIDLKIYKNSIVENNGYKIGYYRLSGIDKDGNNTMFFGFIHSNSMKGMSMMLANIPIENWDYQEVTIKHMFETLIVK